MLCNVHIVYCSKKWYLQYLMIAVTGAGGLVAGVDTCHSLEDLKSLLKTSFAQLDQELQVVLLKPFFCFFFLRPLGI